MSISLAIVEDLDEVREGLEQFISLNKEFKILDTFKTAEEAIYDLPRLKPDIVIMDINLPGVNGIDCIKEVRNKIPNTQFMMFTVYENDEKVFEALKAGATGYLLKSTGLVQLIEALKELHNGGSPMSSNIARKLVTIFHERENKLEHMEALSQRENETLQLLSQGLLYKEIAVQLSISVSTVRQHIHKIYEKLHVQNRTEAINKAIRKN
jgi:DNA-binding NarL/FixJ family response regulator